MTVRGCVALLLAWACSGIALAATDDAAKTDAAAPAPAVGAGAPAGDGAPRLRVRGRSEPASLFGTYRLRLALARPKFDDGLKFYDELYGRPALYPTLAADWFAFDWYATLGLSFRMGYYTADGYTAKVVEDTPTADIDAADVEQDKNGPTTLTLLPLQIALTAEMTPFKGKWIVLDGWLGYERLYFQEVRTSAADANAAMMQAATEEDEADVLTNKGWKNATVIGASANILLNPIDESAANSMRGAMGLGYIYLSPFMEIVRQTSKDGISFGRSSVGVGFTFESTH